MHELVPKEYVFHAVFAVVQRKILIYGAYAKLHRPLHRKKGMLRSAYGHAAAVRPEGPGEYLYQRGFARAVVAHYSRYAALANLCGYPVQRPYMAEMLCYILYG